MSIIHKGGMDPAEFAGRTMYRVMETKQMQKEAEYSVEDRVKERPAGPKLRDRVRSIPGATVMNMSKQDQLRRPGRWKQAGALHSRP